MADNAGSFSHQPVLLQEVLEALPPDPQVMIDCTLGGAGHSLEVLQQHPELQLHGLDRDADALKEAERRLAPFNNRVTLHHHDFAEGIQQLLTQGVKADFILADLGVSSYQLDQGSRGFSFRKDAPLDMRMDQRGGRTAADLVNELEERELMQILRDFGEEPLAKRIAGRIVQARGRELITSTWQLADIIREAVPKKMQFQKLHPATKSFQALRIAVNEELEQLDQLLNFAPEALNFGGRIAIISFHSLEDRRVKQRFNLLENPCQCPKEFPRCICGLQPTLRRVHRKPILGTAQEIEENPRARSAKMRVAEKV